MAQRLVLVTSAQATRITAQLVHGGIEVTSIVTDFKSIRRKLDRQEQKAEFEAKNPPEPAMYGWPYGVAVPFADLPPGNPWGVKI